MHHELKACPQIQGVADMILIRTRLVQCYDNIVATTKLCSTLVVVSDNLLPKVKHTSFQFLQLHLVGPYTWTKCFPFHVFIWLIWSLNIQDSHRKACQFKTVTNRLLIVCLFLFLVRRSLFDCDHLKMITIGQKQETNNNWVTCSSPFWDGYPAENSSKGIFKILIMK